jgi:hypothetical protein
MILKIGENGNEKVDESINSTANEINLRPHNSESKILEFLINSIKTLPHKSILYGALLTKISRSLAKKVVEGIIYFSMPLAFADGNKMSCSAFMKFLG